jgi:methylmalonyl-CoA mutase
MAKNEKLFDQFPPVSTKEWMDKIAIDLKGADFDDKLVWKIAEGFNVKPFYREEDIENLTHINTLPGEYPYLRGTKVKDNNWLIRQNIEVSDYSEANGKALTILMKGVDSLGFIITDIESVSLNNLRSLLNNIHIDIVEINFLCNGKAKEILDHIVTISKERGVDPLMISGAIEADPIGRLAANGKLCVSVEEGFDYLTSLTLSASVFPNLQTVHLNASWFNNSGAGIVEELAFAVSIGCEYMKQLTDRGIDTDLAASKIRFCFGIGPHYFPEIAKLRAARLLWSVIIKGFEPADLKCSKMVINSVTSRRDKTVNDPYINMLRTQTEAMSATLGGANSLTVEPFDLTFRQPDEFSERIARNQQLILKEEAYFDKVADPGAGSYYIENLTSLMAENAWKLFLEIEEKGGFLSCRESGFINEKLAMAVARQENEKVK